MENITSYINGSHENETFLPQFPFWQSTLAIWIITITLIQPALIATNLILLVTMLKSKKLHHPLNFIHMSILVSQIASRLIFFVSTLAYFPSGWKDCNCSVFGSSLQRSVYIFVTVYEPIAFAFLSCLQLLQVKGKQKRLTVAAVISICISIVYSAIFPIQFFAFQVKQNSLRSDLLLCNQVCLSDQQKQTLAVSSAFIFVFLSFIPFAWIPSLVIVIITATWSCVIFKKSYTGGDDQLNKRILSIPLVMPIVIMGNNLFSGFIVRALISEIFVRLPFGGFRRYWVAFAQFEVTYFLDAFNDFFYPIVLLYLMPPLRQALRKSNASVAVAPAAGRSATNTESTPLQALVQTEANDSSL